MVKKRQAPQNPEPRKIVLTGAQGFLGTQLGSALFTAGHSVCMTGLTAEPSLPWQFDQGRILWAAKDVTDPNLTLPDCDVVIHLAADAAESKSPYSPASCTLTGAYAVANVARAALLAGATRFIYPSSAAVYGPVTLSGDLPATRRELKRLAATLNLEDAHCNPGDIYGANKLCGERVLQVLASVHGLSVFCPRLHNLYGPGQSFTNPYRNVIPKFIRQILVGNPLRIHDGMWRQFTFLPDLLPTLVYAAQCNDLEGVYNLGADTPYTVLEVAQVLLKLAGGSSPLEVTAGRVTETNLGVCSHVKARNHKILRFLHRETPLSQALAATYQRAVKVYGFRGEALPPFRWRPVELPERLPEDWRHNDESSRLDQSQE